MGRGTVGIKSAITATNQHVFIVVPLKHFDNNGKSKNGTDQGEVVLRAFLEAPKPAASAPPVKPSAEPVTASTNASAPVPASTKSNSVSTASNRVEYDESKPLKLRLNRLQARDLKDKGGSWDKQDPALRITIGTFKPFNTERLEKSFQFCSYFFILIVAIFF